MTNFSRIDRRSILGLLGGVALSTFARPGLARPPLDTLVAGVFRPLMARHDIPGLAVAVTDHGQQSIYCYGVASRESGAPVSPETLFELGSVSKCFTATLASYAQALGRLSLTHTPGQYLTELRGSDIDRATLLDFGTYAAGGLPLQFPEGIASPASIVEYYRQFKPTARPGTVRLYSNPSIGLMGHVAALAMKRDFAELCEAELFPQFGLKHSGIRLNEAAAKTYAWGYNKANQPTRVSPGAFDAEAYGVKSTATDMLRFLEANIDPATLPSSWRQAVMNTQVGRYQVGEMVQGLGWEQYPWPLPVDRLLAGNSNDMVLGAHPVRPLVATQAAKGAILFNKTGSTNGFGAYAAFVPERRIGLVMLANRNFPNADRIKATHAVLAALS